MEAFERHRDMERLLRVIDMDCESLNIVGEMKEKMTVVPNVLRNLSGVDVNEMIMGRHTSLLSQCARFSPAARMLAIT